MLVFMFNWALIFSCPSQKFETSWTSRGMSKASASPVDVHSPKGSPTLRVRVGPSIQIEETRGLSLAARRKFPPGRIARRVWLEAAVGRQPPSIDRAANQPFFATLEPSTVQNEPPVAKQLEYWWKTWFTVRPRASRKDWVLVKRWRWSWGACWTSRASRAPASPTRGWRRAWRSGIASSGWSQGVKPDMQWWNETPHDCQQWCCLMPLLCCYNSVPLHNAWLGMSDSWNFMGRKQFNDIYCQLQIPFYIYCGSHSWPISTFRVRFRLAWLDSLKNSLKSDFKIWIEPFPALCITDIIKSRELTFTLSWSLSLLFVSVTPFAITLILHKYLCVLNSKHFAYHAL